LLTDLGIAINEIIPEGCSVENLQNLPKAWFNIVPYREVGLMTAIYLEKEYSNAYLYNNSYGNCRYCSFYS
jgi:light-independent protochlorophyllide reductase subunit B